MSLVKSTLTIGFYTLLSRISGFVRDVMMANLIGASWLSDAFFVAFKLPNFFRRLFAEGAFNAAFIPSFSSILTERGREDAVRFAGEVMSVLLLVLLVLNAIFIVFMPWITPLFAPGFADTPEKFDLTVTLSQITFPYILFISLVSLLGGVLNSMGKFAAPAASPILLNLCMIGGMLWLNHLTPTPAHALSYAVFIAGLVQLGWLVLACVRSDMMPPLVSPRMTKQVKTMLLLMAPAALGSGVQQLNLLIDVVIASHIPDAVSYLYYADRITESMRKAIGETERRRAKQIAYNEAHGIQPQAIVKRVKDLIDGVYSEKSGRAADDQARAQVRHKAEVVMSETDLAKAIKKLEKDMLAHAKNLEFEAAARLRDQLAVLKQKLFGA